MIMGKRTDKLAVSANLFVNSPAEFSTAGRGVRDPGSHASCGNGDYIPE
jgi:hypothetical protein